jgi:hypothetical protein
MNSYNHYAYGAIGSWMYQVVTGLEVDPEVPGYKHTLIQPRPGGGLSQASATLNTMYGEVASAWKLEGETFTLAVTIPANARATVRLPDASLEDVTESGQPLSGAEGITQAYQDGDVVVVEAGSGQYEFSYTAPELATQLAAANKLSTNSTLKKLFDDDAARAVLERHVPELLDIPPQRRQRVMGISLKQLAAYMPTTFTEERLNAIDEALAKL